VLTRPAVWLAVAIGLAALTALQVLVVVLAIADGSSIPLSTLSGLLTFVLGNYAISGYRQLRRTQSETRPEP
jgi:uncharacterized membrane protein (DUF4010 family)